MITYEEILFGVNTSSNKDHANEQTVLLKKFGAFNSMTLAKLVRCHSINDALLIPECFKLFQITESWEGRADAFFLLMILLGHANTIQHSEEKILCSWGKLTQRKKASLDINEARFLKLIRAGDWPEFLSAATVMVKMFQHYSHKINKLDLIDLIKFRSLTWGNLEKYSGSNSFEAVCVFEFYKYQSTGTE